MAQTGSDGLFEIRNAFYIGNYQGCINEAQKAKFSNPDHQLEKDIFMYRAYIAQHKFGVVVNDIRTSSIPELQSVFILAAYMGGNVDKKNEVLSSMEESLQSYNPDNKMLPLIAGLIYYLEENYDAALRLLHKSDNLECCALAVQSYLAIHRVDLAQKLLNVMKEIDEDCTITQISQAWVNLSRSGDKLQDAFYIFQELAEKYSSTPLLLNGQAAALLALAKYEEAEPLLQEALDKDPNCPETLINMIVLSQHMGKSAEVSMRYFNQLKDSNMEHPFVRDYKSKEQEFDRLLKSYSPAVTA